MMSNTKQDRAKVAGDHDHEAKYEAAKTGASKTVVRDPGSIDLAQRRILVVEDEYILAADIVDQIEDHNGVVLGPVETLEQGLSALAEQKPDACIVNINLGVEKVYELADRLIEQDIPFVFASSEARASIPDRFNDVPLHTKPIDMIKAAATLMRTRAA